MNSAFRKSNETKILLNTKTRAVLENAVDQKNNELNEYLIPVLQRKNSK